MMLATMISDPTEPARALWERMNARDWDGARLLDGGFTAAWPQTGELIPSPAAYVGLNQAYPGNWKIKVQSVDPSPDGAVVRARITNGDEVVHAIGFYRIMGGRILSAEEFFADSGTPPYDRSEFTERLSER